MLCKIFQKDLLHEVLGILEVAKSVVTESVDSLAILFHQLTKRFYVTIKAFFYQRKESPSDYALASDTKHRQEQ